MTLFDYVVLAIVALSVLLSITRGFVRELLSLAGWVIAFMVANSFAAVLASLLPSTIGNDSIRVVLAFGILFLAALLAMGLVTMLVSALVSAVGLGFTDRFLGSLFGFMRGFAVVLLIVLGAGLTALPQEPFWQKAVLSKPLEAAALMVMPSNAMQASRTLRSDMLNIVTSPRMPPTLTSKEATQPRPVALCSRTPSVSRRMRRTTWRRKRQSIGGSRICPHRNDNAGYRG